MPVNTDYNKSVAAAPSLVSGTRTATGNGTGVDLAGYNAALVIVSAGVITDGTHTLKLQESDDNSTFTDVAAGDQAGTLTALTSGAGGSATQQVAYIGSKRYIRAVTTVTGSPSTGGAYGVIVVRTQPRTRPTS